VPGGIDNRKVPDPRGCRSRNRRVEFSRKYKCGAPGCFTQEYITSISKGKFASPQARAFLGWGTMRSRCG